MAKVDPFDPRACLGGHLSADASKYGTDKVHVACCSVETSDALAGNTAPAGDCTIFDGNDHLVAVVGVAGTKAENF